MRLRDKRATTGKLLHAWVWKSAQPHPQGAWRNEHHRSVRVVFHKDDAAESIRRPRFRLLFESVLLALPLVL
jgi:hypothetical protein